MLVAPHGKSRVTTTAPYLKKKSIITNPLPKVLMGLTRQQDPVGPTPPSSPFSFLVVAVVIADWPFDQLLVLPPSPPWTTWTSKDSTRMKWLASSDWSRSPLRQLGEGRERRQRGEERGGGESLCPQSATNRSLQVATSRWKGRPAAGKWRRTPPAASGFTGVFFLLVVVVLSFFGAHTSFPRPYHTVFRTE